MHWAAGKLGVVRSMFFDEGKEWGRSRRLISPSMNEHNIAGMVPVISEVRRWREGMAVMFDKFVERRVDRGRRRVRIIGVAR